MNSQPTQFNTLVIPARKTSSAENNSISMKYIYHWPLFIIGLLIAFAGLTFYLHTYRPIYPIKATLLINDEKKAPDQKSALHEIDLTNSAKIIENEIEILKSNQLISQVVKDLQLGIIYQKKIDQFSKIDLYKSSPVEINLQSSTDEFPKTPINIEIKDNKSFFIIDAEGRTNEFYFYKIYKNSWGTWKVKPTKFLENYLGAKIMVTIADPQKIALQYQSAIDISLSNKLATAVVLTLNDEVPARGKDFLNDLIHNYNSTSLIEKNRQTKSTLHFLDQRIDSLTKELSTAERGIENFKSSRGLTDIPADSKIRLENMQANDSKLNDVIVQLSVIEGIEHYVNSNSNSEKLPAIAGFANLTLSNQIEKLSVLQLQKDRLLATTPETNPDFEPINSQISTIKAAIKENIKNTKISLLNTKHKLQSFNVGFESSIKNIPIQERQYINIKRQQSIKENLYSYLLQKREEISVNYASTLADDRVVDQAYVGAEKGQRKSIAIALAFLIGLSLPAGIIYSRNTSSSKIITLQEIKDKTEIPIIAELPYEITKNPIVINANTSAISEQFRTLRTKMYYLNSEKHSGRITLLTSSVPGEGKSFISSNLSVAFAYSNRKTVLLELDLRKPQLTNIFNISNNHVGITDFVLGKATLSEIIRPSGLESNLDIISSGTTVNNPSELLERQQLKDLIFTLKDIYDDIIIDSPPVHLVPDAIILSRLADITLYTLRQGFTEKIELNFIKELHDQNQLHNINLIFNGIERSKYGYGYKYGDKYYSQANDKKFGDHFTNFLKRF